MVPMRLSVEKVAKLFEDFGKLKIAVVGDLILDKYVFGRVERISPEAPVPVFEIEREEYRAGGAANVSLNLNRWASARWPFSGVSETTKRVGF